MGIASTSSLKELLHSSLEMGPHADALMQIKAFRSVLQIGS